MKHVAVRMCVICKKRRPKTELARYVLAVREGEPAPDAGQTLPGRGVYHCFDGVCGAAFARRLAGKKAKGRSV
ncbi:MAG: DUF448 domain-containing protein [Desulfovibrio sp.]|nr:DUF448 domain-containing protein [Desulfovibrio sp.]